MYYLWLDLETTGLDPDTCCVIEVGAILTDEDFVEIDRYDRVIGPKAYDPTAWERDALKMHRESGLLDAHLDATPVAWRSHLNTMCRGYGGSILSYGEVALAGRNPHFDRQWFDPDGLHYRMFDVTTIYMLRPDLKPANTSHRAIEDIEADLEAARAFRNEVAR
jgi:oligoribonuclease